jgi:ATP-dependent DNA helicase RecG
MKKDIREIDKLIHEGESEKLEFKSSFDREAIETLVAFANSSGGFMLVGVQDDGVICGVTIGKESIQNWINQIKMTTTPAIIPDVTPIIIEEKNVVLPGCSTSMPSSASIISWPSNGSCAPNCSRACTAI